MVTPAESRPAVITLRADAASARIVPALGGRVTACHLPDASGRPRAVLHPYPEDHTRLDDWGKGGIYPLVPYNGRLPQARLWHEGHAFALQPHAGSAHTLHGIAQRRPWQLLAHDGRSARLAYRHDPQVDDAAAHWPWPFEATLDLRLTPIALHLTLAMRQTHSAPAPAGIGLHPYLALAPRARLAYQASAPWPFDADYLASRDAPLHDDLQAVVVDTLHGGEFTRFHHRWAGPLRLSNPLREGRLATLLTADGALDRLVLHSPAGAPWLCAEPVSHLPHARAAPEPADPCDPRLGWRVLAPGEVLQGRMSLHALPG